MFVYALVMLVLQLREQSSQAYASIWATTLEPNPLNDVVAHHYLQNFQFKGKVDFFDF